MQLPFFVYGTLIPGQPNAYLWGEGIERMARAEVANGRLFDMGHFPMLLLGEGGPIQGVVLWLKADMYGAIVPRIDALEQYDPERDDNVYERVVCRARLAETGEEVAAWLYLGVAAHTVGRGLIPGGDWVGYAEGEKAGLQAWWDEVGHTLDRHPLFYREEE
ncbi:MAG TPA: gamma-glutamylcyclotransferase family protein [Anaerolineae bacterium]|nr:gamma-glutamylcyclotransferase family protein [Anaerolineae bacterium]